MGSERGVHTRYGLSVLAILGVACESSEISVDGAVTQSCDEGPVGAVCNVWCGEGGFAPAVKYTCVEDVGGVRSWVGPSSCVKCALL